jgi:ATP-dependent DNA helicase Rep
LPVALFDRDADARERWQARCAHVLIDEYQDTNPAQYRLFRHLVGTSTPFTAVGDDDQAIYGWRGATLDNLAALPRDYPDLRVIKLEQNYRSTVRILRCANALIGNNPKLFDKRLWTELAHGDPLRVTPAADEDAEADLVVRQVAVAPVRAPAEVLGLRDPLPGQSSGARVRIDAAHAIDPVRDLRRTIDVRAHRDQGRRCLPAPDRER